MSATVAYVVIAITVLAIFAVGAGGWWIAEKTLSEDDHDDHDGHEPPARDSAI